MNEWNFNEALALEENLPPGPYEIKALLQAPLSPQEINELRAQLINAGVSLTSLSQNGPFLFIKAVKPEPVEGIAILPFVAAIAIVGGLAITAYSIHELPRIIDAFVPLTLIIMLGIVVIKAAPAIARRG